MNCIHDVDAECYRIDHSYFLRPLMLSVEESLSLMLMTRKLMDQRLVPNVSTAIAAGLKIESALPVEIRDHTARKLQRVKIVIRQVIGNARQTRVDISAAQFLGCDNFARCGLNQRRAGEEDGSLFLHDDGFIAHRGTVCTARSA